MQIMYNIPSILKEKVCPAETAAEMIFDGAVVSASGYTAVGDPKATFYALAEKAKADGTKIHLVTAAQMSKGAETALVDAGALISRAPFVVCPAVSKAANAGSIKYTEAAMSKMPRLVEDGCFGSIDFAIIEALDVSEDGDVTPTTSIGMNSQFCRQARYIILEINRTQPEALSGIHDILETPYHMGQQLKAVNERVGKTTFKIDLSKVVAVVFSDIPDEEPAPVNITAQESAICSNLMEFLECNFDGRSLPPLQTGIGGVSLAILNALSKSDYENIKFYCGALQEPMLDMLESGKASQISGGAFAMTQAGQKRFSEIKEEMDSIADLRISLNGGTAHEGDRLADKLVLRNMEVANSLIATSSVGLIALNTGIEMDIYGNLNTSHILGRKVVNGIGGGASFAECSALSVMLMPSARKDGAISTFVESTGHVDIVHHDVDVVISEQGIADLRGKTDIEAAQLIISNCVHPDYKDKLADYLDEAIARGGHHPL